MDFSDPAAFDDFVQRLGRGDREAFARFVTLYGPVMFATVRRAVPDESLEFAQEAVQDAMARLLSGSDRERLSAKFDSPDALKRYACKVAYNRAMDILRRENRYRKRVQSFTGGAENLVPINEAVDRAIERQELMEQVKREIERLPANYSTAIMEYYINGKSFAEISEQYRIPQGTLRSHVSRGLERLREAFPDAFGPATEGPTGGDETATAPDAPGFRPEVKS